MNKAKSYFLSLILLCVLIGIMNSCGPLGDSNSANTDLAANQGKEKDTIVIKNDSLEYEIQIIEVGFYSWLQTQRPRGYYNQAYLENRNSFYVTRYNIRASNPIRYGPNLYPREINYDANIDYGYEVNYLLFNYFKFFEQKYNQNLMR